MKKASKGKRCQGFADRLNEAIRAAGMIQIEVADASGCPRSNLSHWMNGHAEPGLFNLVRLATALGVSTDWLLGLQSKTKSVALRSELKMARATMKRARVALDGGQR